MFVQHLVTVGVGAGGGASPSSSGKLQTALLPRIALAAASYALAACTRLPTALERSIRDAMQQQIGDRGRPMDSGKQRTSIYSDAAGKPASGMLRHPLQSAALPCASQRMIAVCMHIVCSIRSPLAREAHSAVDSSKRICSTSSGLVQVPSQTRTPFSGSLISAAYLPQGRLRTPL